jgi:hypothetical protein
MRCGLLTSTMSPEVALRRDESLIQPNRIGSDRIGSLFDEADSILELTAGIPHVLSYTNAMPKNLFPVNDPIHGEITVGIDWAPTGSERAGLDATYSLASAARWLELPIDMVERTFEPTLNAYCEGLISSGWSGDLELVRLVAYAVNGTTEAITISSIISRTIADDKRASEFTKTTLGMTLEENFYHWQPEMAHALDNADRAVELARNLA